MFLDGNGVMLLKLVEGYFEGHRFVMQKICGFDWPGVFRADKLRSLARLIDDRSPVMLFDEGQRLHIPVEMNRAFSQELLEIADQLEKMENE